MAASSDQPPGKRPASNDIGSWYRMAGVGLEFAVAIALFGGIGWLLDRWLQTAPWLLIVGVFLGFAAGLGIVIKLAKQMFHD